MHLPITARPRLEAVRAVQRWSMGTSGRYRTVIGSSASAGVVQRSSSLAALAVARRSLRTVPAYRAFVQASNWRDDRHLSPAARIALLPETTKRNYIDAFSTEDRCRGGRIPDHHVEIDESSGSSGRPYSWVRSRAELREIQISLSRLAEFLLGNDLVTINGFSMGAWATGTNVSAALAHNGLLKSTGPDPEKILTALDLVGPERRYVITGYPPFLLDLIEHADREGFPLERFRLSGIVGGEAMSEALRTRLLTRFESVYSAYGASDLDIGVAAEMPLSVWIRQRSNELPELASALFGDTRRLPMLFQYDPLDYFAERNDAGELVVTVNRPSVLSPRIRYNVKDNGGAIEFDRVMSICREFGLDPLRDAPRPAGGKNPRLPFLFVGGRSDSTISFFGANIYPEDVEQAVFADSPDVAAEAVHGFALELIESPDATVKPCVHIELRQDACASDRLAGELGERVRRRLAANSRDYRVALGEDPRAGEIEIRLHAYESGPFAAQGERLKRRYVIGASTTAQTGSFVRTGPGR